ncbi:putative aldo/keto reductase family protein [Klebsiella pneumoniae]|uniref:aldo/keto reductase n=1 Tax=Klebsiella pneumoniae TaxID=573 RepID=UPI000DE60B00|nr:putative aldo/keto reductase family protein [Klebsiella pneumoniae]
MSVFSDQIDMSALQSYHSDHCFQIASIAEKHAVPRAHVAIAWLLSKSVITAPIIGATKPEHLSTAISALDFSLSDAEITELEVRYLPHPVDGIIPPLPDTPPSLTPPSAIQNY